MGRKRFWAVVWALVLLVGCQTLAWGALPSDDLGTDQSATDSKSASHDRTALFEFPRIDLKTQFSLSVGLRRDNFKWSIAAADGHPNVLSELTWSDVDSYQISLANRSRFGRYMYLRFQLDYAQIVDGSVRDSDYAGDYRTGEYSRSISQSNGDQIWDISLGVGYPFDFLQGDLLVVPLVGGSLNKQNFRITDGYQVVSSPGEYPLGPLPSQLNSTYRAKWEGFWLGCDLQYTIKPNNPHIHSMQWALSMEYHWTRYTAKADWNLRSDLDHPVSFNQDADGHGLSLQGEWAIGLTPRLDCTLTLNHLDWSTDYGKDHFNHNTNPQTRRFNGADWDSRSFMVGLAYRFF